MKMIWEYENEELKHVILLCAFCFQLLLYRFLQLTVLILKGKQDSLDQGYWPIRTHLVLTELGDWTK